MVNERPEVELVICGIAAPSDLQALWQLRRQEWAAADDVNAGEPDDQELEALHSLAELRSRSVKEYLVGEGISSDRLITCKPEYSDEPAVKPSVELGI